MSDIKKAINQFDFSQSEYCILSIRLKTDGFSFSIYNTITKEYYAEEIKTDPSLSLTANIKRVFKEIEFLSKPFQQKRIVFIGIRYLLLPLELFEDEQKETLFYHSHTKKENDIILYDIVKRNNIVVLYAIDKSAFTFLKEWDKELSIQSQTSLLIEKLYSVNKISKKKQMFLNIQTGKIDLFSFSEGELLSINTFTVQSVADILYYSLHLWKQQGFNQQQDEFIFLNNSKEVKSIIPELSKYIKNIQNSPFTIPIELKEE
ncbi:MAG: DUF3822 family protein [Bacteroidales bacterium]|nr:DUF3822 family protein [Bacteroidales bacterium]